MIFNYNGIECDTISEHIGYDAGHIRYNASVYQRDIQGAFRIQCGMYYVRTYAHVIHPALRSRVPRAGRVAACACRRAHARARVRVCARAWAMRCGRCDVGDAMCVMCAMRVMCVRVCDAICAMSMGVKRACEHARARA